MFADVMRDTFLPPADPRFNERFRRSTEYHVNRYLRNPNHDLVNNEPITEDDVSAAINKHKKNSAPGEDGITYSSLKHLPESAIQFLSTILNSCYTLSYHPPVWKHATIVMILKPGKPSSDPSSYRPISLINTLGKVYESIILLKLSDHLNRINIIPSHQFGFRPHHSVQDAVLRLTTDIIGANNNGKFTAAAFLDLERAFDRVWHKGIIAKLRSCNTPPMTTRAVNSFLLQRTACIKFHKHPSYTFPIHVGVPQGSILSPLLFILYCYDIPIPRPPNAKLQLYADDTLFWATQPHPEAAVENLQNQLTSFENWLSKWRIRPNPTKTRFIIFHHRSKPTRNQQRIRLWDQNIQQTRLATYLGFKIFHTLSWKHDMDYCVKSARKRLPLIGMLRGRLRGCSRNVQYHTYKTFVRPLMDYRAAVYCATPKSTEKFLPMERRLLRRIQGLHWEHPSALVHQNTTVEPIDIRFKTLQRKFADRCVLGTSASSQLLQTGSLLHRRPRFKYPDPPTCLLYNASTLPQNLQFLLDVAPPNLYQI